MRILILGGTVFLGRHLATAARAAGHEVVLFNRGRSNPAATGGMQTITGDRDGGLDALKGHRFDAVLDTSGYVPRVVRASAEALADATDHYTFVSTLSVYTDTAHAADESAPLGTLDDPTIEQVDGETYGPLKALCEEAVRDVYGERALVVRPGLIVGPYDPTNRYTYWPRRLHDGGRVLAPGPRDRAVQFIDARDLSEWTIRLAEARANGTFNATSAPVSIGETLDACARPDGTELVWVDDDFLANSDVTPWMELPLWVPDEPDTAGFFQTDVSRALASGLTFRPLDVIARDTLAWDLTYDGKRPAGLAREKETELLAQWSAGP
jgi:2'-hydroxyisoflavone reductase